MIAAIIPPRITQPSVYQAIIVAGCTGATRSSSIDFWNFAQKNEDDTFAYALVMTAMRMIPGIRNAIYWPPQTSPIREPINPPKIIK